jgi:hypothetical protein
MMSPIVRRLLSPLRDKYLNGRILDLLAGFPSQMRPKARVIRRRHYHALSVTCPHYRENAWLGDQGY